MNSVLHSSAIYQAKLSKSKLYQCLLNDYILHVWSFKLTTLNFLHSLDKANFSIIDFPNLYIKPIHLQLCPSLSIAYVLNW